MTPHRSAFAAGLLALSALAVPGAVSAATDSFVCYKTSRPASEAQFPGATVVVEDEAETRLLDLKRPRRICIPAGLPGGVIDATIALESYKAKTNRASAPYRRDSNVKITNVVGDLFVEPKAKPRTLLVPSSFGFGSAPPAPDPAAHEVDHYRCHKAKQSVPGAFASGIEFDVDDVVGGTRRVALKKISQLCAPVDALGATIDDPEDTLACYKVGRVAGETVPDPVASVDVDNQFGPHALNVRKGVELCLPSRAIGRCNEFSELCDLPFDGVSYATTHNAMSNAEEGWFFPNQSFSITRQLDDGARALMLDTWYFGGDVVLCHGGDLIPCDLSGMKPLIDGLAEIKDFLDRRPNDVVSIIFESYVTEADTAAEFLAAGLMPYLHVQPAASPWPSLRDLVEAGTRLVVFTDDGSASLPWHLYVWSHAWETHFSNATAFDFSCVINRGSMSNSLFILNHFLTNPLASPGLANLVNHNPLFIDRSLQCQSEGGQLPNFVTVDFYDIGDVFDVVDQLNGVER